MKSLIKIVVISLLLSFLSLNFLSISAKNLNTLFNYNTINYIISYNENLNPQEILDALIDYSKINNISIGQITYNTNGLNFYETNYLSFIDVYNQNNSGKLTSINDTKCDEKFETTILSQNISINNLNTCNYNNVGLKSEIYVRFFEKSKVSSTDVEKFLSHYGTVEVVNNQSNIANILRIVNLILILILTIILILILEYYLEVKKEKILILNILKFKEKNILREINKDFIIFLSPLIMIIILISGLLIYNFNNSMLVYISILFQYMLIILLILLYIDIKVKKININFKGVNRYSKEYKIINRLNYVFKAILTLILMLLIFVLSKNIIIIDTAIKNNNDWMKTKEIYKFNLTFDPSLSLSKSKLMDEKLLSFYERIEDKVLLVDSNAFLMNQDDKYTYEINEESNHDFLYGMNGRTIIANENYLKENNIKTVDEKGLKEEIINDDETLNVLVPEKFSSYEKKIIQNMKEDFYFQKVDVKNIYYEEMNKKKESINKDDLSINIIYVKNNQNYPTYNFDIAMNNDYYIKDPLTVIYNKSVDSSFLTSYLSSYVFFKSSTNNPYDEYSEDIRKTGVMNYISSVESVYSIGGKYVDFIRTKIYISILIILIILMLVLLLIKEEVDNNITQYKQKYKVLFFLRKNHIYIIRNFIFKITYTNTLILLLVLLIGVGNNINITIILLLYILEISYYIHSIRKVKNDIIKIK